MYFHRHKLPSKREKGDHKRKTVHVVFAAASTYTVLEAATTCTQAKCLFRGLPRLFRVNSVLRLRGSAKPVLGELQLWVKGHPYCVRFCKSLDVNLTEITATYPLMKRRSMNLKLAVPGRRYQARVYRLSLAKCSPSTSTKKMKVSYVPL